MKKFKEFMILVAAIALTYAFFHLVGIGCPLKYITGISCMGCGMTRAYISLLKMDIASAFYYHPLFVIPPIAVAMYYFRDKIPGKVYKTGLFTMAGLFIIIYLLRLNDPSDEIVAFEPCNGIIFKGIHGVTDFVSR